MFPLPIGTPHATVIVEYDCHRSRKQKTFTNPVAAKLFYVAKSKEAKNPRVISPATTTHERRHQ